MATKTTKAAKPAEASKAGDAPKASSLYADLESASEAALKAGDHALHHALNPVVVALAGVKYLAYHALSSVDGDAAALLEQVRAL
ncbi:hypothetical protein [Paraburkholderia sp. BL17N1]|uniref:hypothetical protein n=1 Tax=Paraburkholderia sp. BL17N1 TaxID=1938798 RepID=UPI000EAFCD0E|nr:hypothetical protein [Paraburkholderia sp. BL17N1]RKR46305.1 hypothetical protein B0G82_3988 [Paraburkholderia sp. BL17N1]